MKFLLTLINSRSYFKKTADVARQKWTRADIGETYSHARPPLRWLVEDRSEYISTTGAGILLSLLVLVGQSCRPPEETERDGKQLTSTASDATTNSQPGGDANSSYLTSGISATSCLKEGPDFYSNEQGCQSCASGIVYAQPVKDGIVRFLSAPGAKDGAADICAAIGQGWMVPSFTELMTQERVGEYLRLPTASSGSIAPFWTQRVGAMENSRWLANFGTSEPRVQSEVTSRAALLCVKRALPSTKCSQPYSSAISNPKDPIRGFATRLGVDVFEVVRGNQNNPGTLLGQLDRIRVQPSDEIIDTSGKRVTLDAIAGQLIQYFNQQLHILPETASLCGVENNKFRSVADGCEYTDRSGKKTIFKTSRSITPILPEGALVSGKGNFGENLSNLAVKGTEGLNSYPTYIPNKNFRPYADAQVLLNFLVGGIGCGFAVCPGQTPIKPDRVALRHSVALCKGLAESYRVPTMAEWAAFQEDAKMSGTSLRPLFPDSAPTNAEVPIFVQDTPFESKLSRPVSQAEKEAYTVCIKDDTRNRPRIAGRWTIQTGQMLIDGASGSMTAGNHINTIEPEQVADALLSTYVSIDNFGPSRGVALLARYQRTAANKDTYYSGGLFWSELQKQFNLEIKRVLNGESTTVKSVQLPFPWAVSDDDQVLDPVTGGLLTFVVDGSRLQLYFDGKKYVDITDSGIPNPGSVGVNIDVSSVAIPDSVLTFPTSFSQFAALRGNYSNTNLKLQEKLVWQNNPDFAGNRINSQTGLYEVPTKGFFHDGFAFAGINSLDKAVAMPVLTSFSMNGIDVTSTRIINLTSTSPEKNDMGTINVSWSATNVKDCELLSGPSSVVYPFKPAIRGVSVSNLRVALPISYVKRSETVVLQCTPVTPLPQGFEAKRQLFVRLSPPEPPPAFTPRNVTGIWTDQYGRTLQLTQNKLDVTMLFTNDTNDRVGGVVIPPQTFTGVFEEPGVIALKKGFAAGDIATLSRDEQTLTFPSGGVLTRQRQKESSCAAVKQNPRNKYDANDDGNVSPLDVLAVVNFINSNDKRVCDPKLFLDIDGDSSVSPLDTLAIVNYLNGRR